MKRRPGGAASGRPQVLALLEALLVTAFLLQAARIASRAGRHGRVDRAPVAFELAGLEQPRHDHEAVALERVVLLPKDRTHRNQRTWRKNSESP